MLVSCRGKTMLFPWWNSRSDPAVAQNSDNEVIRGREVKHLERLSNSNNSPSSSRNVSDE